MLSKHINEERDGIKNGRFTNEAAIIRNNLKAVSISREEYLKLLEKVG